VASGSADGTVRLWDQRTGKTLRILKGIHSSVMSLVFSPDGRLVISGGMRKGERGQVIFSNSADGKTVFSLAFEGGRVTCLAIAPDGRSLAVGNRDGTVLILDISGLSQPR
jgi:WD40 repeat protein